MLGNAWEWCQDRGDIKVGAGLLAAGEVVTGLDQRHFRGGAFGHGPPVILPGSGYAVDPKIQMLDVGFRVGRTMP
jgi:formylglycine-generating enzyme required for sulfatase activity